MKCLKMILHRPQIYLGFCALLLSVFLSFGLSQDSYATSGTCTVNFSNSSNVYSGIFSVSSCTSDFAYFKVKTLSIASTTLSNNTYNISIIPKLYSLSYNTYAYNSNASFVNTDIVWSGSTVTVDFADSNIFSNFYFNPSGVKTLVNSFAWYSANSNGFKFNNQSYIIFEYTTDLSDFAGDSEPCPEVTPCPPIPENPYDQKLDDIKKAILTCAATALAIYLFFCLYNIIVKNGGKR